MLESHREYIKYRQKQLKERIQRAAEEEAAEEAARIAKQEAIAEQERVLLEQQEYERLCREDAQRKEKLTEQKWNSQLNTLIAQIREDSQKDDKIEEIRVIIQNREPSLQELDWDIWLSDPLNQRLADLDFGQAMEMFKRDNLMAKRRRRRGGQSKVGNWALSFTGNGSSGAEDYVTTDFNPDDFNLNLGFTVSYWVRPDEVGNTMFAFGRKHSNNERFVFGINRKRQSYFGIGSNQLTKAWVNMDTPVEESLLDYQRSGGNDYWNLKTDGTWYHFVVTYDDRADDSSGADRKLYVNGVLRQTDTINWDDTGGSTGGIYFGCRNLSDSYNNGWACALSHVAIFNSAQNSDWAEYVYDAGRTGIDHTGEGGLVGYWKFDKGAGNIIKDYSGKGNDGTFGAISGDTTAYPTWEKL